MATPTTEKIEIQKFDDGSVRYVTPITLEQENPLDFEVENGTTLREYIADKLSASGSGSVAPSGSGSVEASGSGSVSGSGL